MLTSRRVLNFRFLKKKTTEIQLDLEHLLTVKDKYFSDFFLCRI